MKIVFIVICTLLGGLTILYGIFKYSEKGIYPQRPEKLDRGKRKKEYTPLEEESEIYCALYEVSRKLSLSWFICYYVLYAIFFSVSIIFTSLLPAIVETNMTLLGAITTCTSIAFALVSFAIYRPSFLALSQRLNIAYMNVFHLAFSAICLYALASGKMPYELQGALIDTVYLMFVMTLYTFVFLLGCSTQYQIKTQRRTFLQRAHTGSFEETIQETGLTVQEFIKKTKKKLAGVGIDVEEFVREREEMADNRKRRGKEEETETAEKQEKEGTGRNREKNKV